MKKSIHSEAEIIKSVKELEGGIPPMKSADGLKSVPRDDLPVEEEVRRHGCKPAS
jgi:hypothetical protein